METTPLYLGAAVGYRQWGVTPENLLAPITDHGEEWVPGVNVASCDALRQEMQVDHQIPALYCECGFYAWHRPTMLPASPWRLTGAIAARGGLQVHAQGFRAGEAQVIGLLRPQKGHGEQVPVEQAHRVAATYSVPLFDDLQQLQAHAQRYAAVIPAGDFAQPADADSTRQAMDDLRGDTTTAEDARALMLRWGLREETIWHFRLGIQQASRYISAPLIAPDDPLWGHYHGMMLTPIYTSGTCSSCGTVVSRKELLQSWLNVFDLVHSRKAVPPYDWMSCPHCRADRESARIGWMINSNFSQHHRWQPTREAPATALYNHQAAAAALLDTDQDLLLTTDIANVWALWQQGHRQVVSVLDAHTDISYDAGIFAAMFKDAERPVPEPPVVMQLKAAADLAKLHDRRLTYVYRGSRPAQMVQRVLTAQLGDDYSMIALRSLTDIKIDLDIGMTRGADELP